MTQPNPDTDELAALRVAFELVSQAVFVVDITSALIIDANPAGCELAGCEPEQLVSAPWSAVAARLPDATQRTIVRDRFVVIVCAQSTDAAAGLEATRDALTGLADRHALQARWDVELASEPTRRLALLFLDLDNFKQVNDTFGHVAGDRVLQTVAQRLAESVRPGDLVVRYGGDEFLVVVEGVSRRRDLDRLARRIARSIRQPIVVAGEEIELTASIGIARRSAKLDAIDALIAEADRAMYRCKVQTGRRAASNSLRPSEQMA